MSELGYLVRRALEEEAGDLPPDEMQRIVLDLVEDVETSHRNRFLRRLIGDICNVIHTETCFVNSQKPDHGPYQHEAVADAYAQQLIALGWITRTDIPERAGTVVGERTYDVVEAEIHDATCQGPCEACGRPA